MNNEKYKINDEGVIIYYELEDGYRCIDLKTRRIETRYVIPVELKRFSMLTFTNAEANDDNLRQYAKDFITWNRELKYQKQKIYFFEYTKSHSDNIAVCYFFINQCEKYYKHHLPIEPLEYKWYEKCYNAGIGYLRKNDLEIQCHSNDFKNAYAIAMHSDTKIPTKPGKEYTLKELPRRKDLQPGFYHVKITSKNDNFRKCFAYSENHVYVKESLYFALGHKNKFNINFELVQNGLPNCYLYDKNDTVKLSSITEDWFNTIVELKKLYPKNPLLKNFASTAWSRMNQRNIITKTSEELISQNIDYGISTKYEYQLYKQKFIGDKQLNVLLNCKKPYKYNIRLKPWVTATCRNMVGELALSNIDNVVRVQCDSISFDKKIDFDDKNFIPEAKTTGLIYWNNVNKYHNKTTGYTSKGYILDDNENDD